MAYLLRTLPVVFAALAASAPQIASACNSRTLCLYWPTQVTDDGFGMLIADPAASGARYTLIRPSPEPPLSGFLGVGGCMTFETQFAEGHKLMVYNEAWVGTPAVRIRALQEDSKDTPVGWDTKPGFWVVDLAGLGPDDFKWLPVTIQAHPLTTIMGTATFVMERFSALGVMPGLSLSRPTGHELNFKYWSYRPGGFGSCGWIILGLGAFDKKFITAHEMGHWLQCEWDGDITGKAYDYMPKDKWCRYEPTIAALNSHALRSAEWSGAAMVEGFAHFIASTAFNDVDVADGDGLFRYYKEVDPVQYPEHKSLVDNLYKVSLLGTDDLGGVNSWTKNACEQDWPVDEVSTELDWMRFYWRFLTRGGTDTPPTLREILEFLQYADAPPQKALWPIKGVNEMHVWPLLEEIMDASVEFGHFLERFQEANTIMGVYNADSGS